MVSNLADTSSAVQLIKCGYFSDDVMSELHSARPCAACRQEEAIMAKANFAMRIKNGSKQVGE